MSGEIDKEWFVAKLDKARKSIGDMARALNIDPSAASRMLSGGRKMKLDEAERIARFLDTTTEEVLLHAGVDVGDTTIKRITLAATISDIGKFLPSTDAAPLPSVIVARAQAAIGSGFRGQVVAAQVRASKGPLSIWDDAVVLFGLTDTIEQTAVGVLSVAKLRDGVQMLGHITKARKTGEATIRLPSGELKDVLLASASPVLAVLP